MKKLLLYISVIVFAICSSVWSEDKFVTLDEFLTSNDLNDRAAFYYIISRCGGLYSYFSVLTHSKSPETSKNYNTLTGKFAIVGSRLRIQDGIDPEKARNDILSNIKNTTKLYFDHSEKHYTRTGSNISDEMKSDSMYCKEIAENISF
jgi:hypothetical protein